MRRIKKENVEKLKSRNAKERSKVWPMENDEFYAQLAVDTFGAGVRDNTFEEKVEIGKAVDNGSIYDDGQLD